MFSLLGPMTEFSHETFLTDPTLMSRTLGGMSAFSAVDEPRNSDENSVTVP
jgi:hypothetical protein